MKTEITHIYRSPRRYLPQTSSLFCNVVFVTHQLAFNFFGGMEVQMLKTKEELEKLAVNVQFFNMQSDRIEDYDILHLFNPANFVNEAYSFIVAAKEREVKTVVSPVFWLSHRYQGMQSFKRRILYHKFMFPLTRKILKVRLIEKILRMADMILPNSQTEMEHLVRLFGLDRSKMMIVPNAADLKFKYGDPALFKEKYGLEDFILFVGRIEDRKNVLGLIRGFKKAKLSVSLVLIGRRISTQYFEKCLREANKRVIFLGPLKHDDPLLLSAYKACKVFVLPSFYETPGLAALEAALAGANIVVTKEGSAYEYFGKHAWYVNPYSVDSIATALKEAYNTPKNSKLSKIVENKFTWRKTAEKTLQAYMKVLE